MSYKEDALELISQPENLAVALEIVKLVDELKPRFQQTFWEDVSAKTASLLNEFNLDSIWRVAPAKGPYDKDYVILVIQPREIKPGQHYIQVGLQQDQKRYGYGLKFGLVWDSLFSDRKKLKTCGVLRSILGAQDFNEDDWWLGYKNIGYSIWKQNFILRMGTERPVFIDEIASLLLDLLRENLDAINAINAELGNLPHIPE